ncbi:YeeE/YedE thiosulfate transporter family protein [Pseudovibrio sp. Tun.PSC04-5.I4]|uniref:YeeE/YedE thiosulfate transporter family protein n=1 Tax=Pseudovibrio sp. Tun.PSC04-5.I4 TaxID=1798213 RepID=UPI00088EEED8|nr:YeeE/YedE thiosulfate transporter family protein [Pseudovibrio sp. Tun.PSC04-5.I4]SDR36301.1 hypothetical protein SAMN04515695_4961 [Pseudovibrio sp. Tun.PSC04-5.I4]
MEVFWLVILGLTMGLVFGVALEKSRVMEPGVLIGQFLFKDYTMLKMFLAATATGLIVLSGLTAFGLAELHPKGFVVGNIIVGGAILGVGIAIAGACPGTVFAQIGRGYKDAWFTVTGGILGAAFYGYNKSLIDGALDLGSFGKITYADLFPALPFWMLGLITAGALIVVMVALEMARPWKTDRSMDQNNTASVGSTTAHA